MARKFFYVSLGILALALAYVLGAQDAEAQAGVTFVGVSAAGIPPYTVYAVTSAGELYSFTNTSFTYHGSYLGGDPVPVQDSSFGATKAKFR